MSVTLAGRGLVTNIENPTEVGVKKLLNIALFTIALFFIMKRNKFQSTCEAEERLLRAPASSPLAIRNDMEIDFYY